MVVPRVPYSLPLAKWGTDEFLSSINPPPSLFKDGHLLNRELLFLVFCVLVVPLSVNNPVHWAYPLGSHSFT